MFYHLKNCFIIIPFHFTTHLTSQLLFYHTTHKNNIKIFLTSLSDLYFYYSLNHPPPPPPSTFSVTPPTSAEQNQAKIKIHSKIHIKIQNQNQKPTPPLSPLYHLTHAHISHKPTIARNPHTGVEPENFVWGGPSCNSIYLSRQPHIHIYIHFFIIYTLFYLIRYIYTTHQTTTKRA